MCVCVCACVYLLHTVLQMSARAPPNSPSCRVPNTPDTPWEFVGSVAVPDTSAPVPDTPAPPCVPNSEVEALRETCRSLERALEVRESRIEILKQQVADLVQLKESRARAREAEIKIAARESDALRATIERLEADMNDTKGGRTGAAPKPDKIDLPTKDTFAFADVHCFHTLKIKSREDLKNMLGKLYIDENKVYHDSWKRDAINQSKYKADWVCDCLSLTDKTDHYDKGDLYTMLTFLLNNVEANGCSNVGKTHTYRTIQHRIAHWFFPNVVTTDYSTYHPKTDANAYAIRQAYACTTGLAAMWKLYEHSPLGDKRWPVGWVKGDHVPHENKEREREDERERKRREAEGEGEGKGKAKRAKR